MKFDPFGIGRLTGLVNTLIQKVNHMAGQLDAVEAQVKANTDAEASAVLLLTQLHDLLEQAKNDPVRLQKVIDDLAASKAALAAAVVANTPPAPPAP